VAPGSQRALHLLLASVAAYARSLSMGSTAARSAAAASSVTKVPAAELFVSEPNPRMFGNPGNPANDHAWTNKNWLKSRFHFSFAEYHNPRNANFGVLRVMNDDLVQPNRGFGEHGHANMEIVTYVVEGNLTHQDSMGTAETLGPGSVQYMTAGSGVRHSEHNLDSSAPLRFIQMWLVPRQRGLTPEYGSLPGGEKAAEPNKWIHLVGDAAGEPVAPILIHTDANIFVATVTNDDDTELNIDLAAGRQAYFLAIDGTVSLEPAGTCSAQKTQLSRHEAAELRGPLSLKVSADPSVSSGQCLMVEMQDDGSTRY